MVIACFVCIGHIFAGEDILSRDRDYVEKQ